MNLNASMSFKFDKKSLLNGLMRVRTLAVAIAVIGLAGYTLYQISLITAISPDTATLVTEREKVDAARIKFDTATIQAISRQTQINTTPDLSNIGKSDPFYQ